MQCLNCENEFVGAFCNRCGQSNKVKRLNGNYLLSELPNSIFQVNHGLLFTIKALITRPGYSIRDFLDGQRKKYFRPFSFLIVTSTLYVLSHYLSGTNTFLEDIIQGIRNGAEDGAQKAASPQFMQAFNWLNKYQTYLMVFMLPFFSLASYLAFIRSKYNYIEHLVLNCYTTGFQMLIYAILGLVFIEENVFFLTSFVISIAYNFWVFNQFFKKTKAMVRNILIVISYTLFVILSSLFLFMIAVVYMI